MARDSDGIQRWFTVQECVGIPGFPTGISNVRNKLEKLAEGLDGVRRRREGGKAIEYHYSIMPEMTKQYLGLGGLANQVSYVENKEIDSTRALWELIYSSMTQNQREAVADVFITGGLKQLMPDVIELANLETSKRREILLQRGSSESTPQAPNLSTHDKKAG